MSAELIIGIVFPLVGHMVIPENIKWNEPEIIFTSFDSLSQAFAEGKLQPKALKDSMIAHIIGLLKPVQEKLKESLNK